MEALSLEAIPLRQARGRTVLVTPSRVLVVGSGGREHALALRLSRDTAAGSVMLAPGSEGAAREFPCHAVAENDVDGLIALCGAERVDFVVIGPEAPLAAGVADRLRDAGLAVFGPSREAARLEASKWFAKQVMEEAGVPTARAERFESLMKAKSALGHFAAPWVLKADGLAAGKGVRVTPDRAEAEEFLAACLESGRFGASGNAVVIEEFLEGEEASVMAVCDGVRHVLLPSARDYKRAFDFDRGLNTGGMGAFAPAGGVDAAIEREVSSRIVTPVLAAMARRGTPFRGVLYCGLMLGLNGPRVVEFNVRFGDPETQVVLPLVTGSLLALLAGAAAGRIDEQATGRARGATVAVALVDEGYPEKPSGVGMISGLDAIKGDDAHVVHAATRREGDQWRITGGRAAYVVALGAHVREARERAYAAVESLGGRGWRCRRDIGAGQGATAVAARGSESNRGRTT
jgi:phosphoribosylamine--glycine ligase